MRVSISLTIVAYNNYNDIKKAVKTIEEKTDKSLKKFLYIVDNGSAISDKDELESFKEFLNDYSDCEYIDAQSNLGFGGGHNYVLPKIDSEYHAIVNPDIIFVEDTLSSILRYMSKNKDVGMCIPQIVDENGNRLDVYREELTVFDMFIRLFCKKLFPKRIAKHTMQDSDFSKPFCVPFGQGSFLVIRTELLKKLNGFDEGYFMYLEDADLCKRVNSISKLMYFPETKVIHKWEKGSHKNYTLFKHHVKSMIYYFQKWGWKFF